MRRALLAAAAVLLVLGLSIPAPPAEAAVVKCKSASGQITYTQNVCPPGSTPQDLPEGVPADADSGSASGPIQLKPLSSRAAVFKAWADSCMSRSKEQCGQYREMEKFCRVEANWGTNDCKAIREVNEHIRAELRNISLRAEQRMREECAEGKDKSCVMATCGLSRLVLHGSTSDLKNCSRVQNFPSGSKWAQIAEGGMSFVAGVQGRQLSIICFDFVDVRNEIGSVVRMRPAVNVTRYPQGATTMYHAGADQTFSTLDAAAIAECAEGAEKLRKSGVRGM
jgi:hypothetical protein